MKELLILLNTLFTTMIFAQVHEYEDDEIASNIIEIKESWFSRCQPTIYRDCEGRDSLKLKKFQLTYFEKGRMIERIADGRDTFAYDSKGNLVIIKEFHANGDLNRLYTYSYKNGTHVGYKMHYDLMRREVKHVIYHDSVSNSKVTYNIAPNGKQENKIKSYLTENGVIAESYKIDSTGKMELFHQNIFDPENRIDSSFTFYSWNPLKSFVIKYHYDSLNRVVKTDHFQYNKLLYKGSESIEYNEANQIKQIKCIDPYDDWSIRYYKYRFDTHGNWIERVLINGFQGEVYEKKIREITYKS